MTIYTVKNEEELEEKLQDLVAGNIIQFIKGTELKRYRIQYDGSYLPINSENNMRNTRNTRKHSEPHIRESLANLRRSHNSKRKTLNAMQSLGMLSITPRHTINKNRKQKPKRTPRSIMKYNRYPNYVRNQTKTRKYHRRLQL